MKYRGSSKEHDPPRVATIDIKSDVFNPPPSEGYPKMDAALQRRFSDRSGRGENTSLLLGRLPRAPSRFNGMR